MTAAGTDEVSPPETIGPLRLNLHVAANDAQQAPQAPRLVRATVVGVMFSALPIMLTHLVLAGEEGGFDPRAFLAAIPVLAVSIWLSRPRDHWFAVGPLGFAQGERFFGEVRWDVLLHDDIENVSIETHRAVDSTGAYRFTGYRVTFESGPKKRVVIEGQAEETPPMGTQVRLPSEEDLPETHELRALRAAVLTWQSKTGRVAEGAEVLVA